MGLPVIGNRHIFRTDGHHLLDDAPFCFGSILEISFSGNNYLVLTLVCTGVSGHGEVICRQGQSVDRHSGHVHTLLRPVIGQLGLVQRYCRTGDGSLMDHDCHLSGIAVIVIRVSRGLIPDSIVSGIGPGGDFCVPAV